MKIADMHCDTVIRLFDQGEGEGLRKNSGHVDLEKMAAADYLLQNFAVFICLEDTRNPFEKAMKAIDRYYRELEKNEDLIAPAFCFQDIVKNQANGKMSAVLTIEEGATVKGSLEYLRDFYRLGVRMMTLTWNYENEIGFPNLKRDEQKKPLFHERTAAGLTDFGIQAVEEMERLGMIPDVSHLSDGGFWDVAKHTKKPFVASHSNAAAKCGVCRNLTDDMIRCLGERGGVTGLNLSADFLTDPGSGDKTELLAAMAEHVAHIADVGGIEVCGLGSDLDGIATNPAVPDASFMPRIADALRKKGFHESEIEKIFYKNVLRVYEELLC
ncbi:MAG: dipeptidase [Candidatus Limivivens sp.]|nr:dipeptidase [Candidatus Limivivens sp.]